MSAANPATFVALCRELFQLEQRHGYRADKASERGHEASIMFRRGDRGVLMLVDHGAHFGKPTVQIRPPDPNERFGLHEALPAMLVECPDYGFRLTAVQLRDVLEHYANFFDAHSAGLLDDYRVIFAAVQKHRLSAN